MRLGILRSHISDVIFVVIHARESNPFEGGSFEGVEILSAGDYLETVVYNRDEVKSWDFCTKQM